MKLLEETGHSYSGISDLLRNDPSKAKPFLEELTKWYYFQVEKQKMLEEELDKVKSNRSHAVSDFVFAMKALDQKQLTFQVDNAIVVVDMLNYEERRINIESYLLTDL